MRRGRRQLFIYWRVKHRDLAAALQALRDWQSTLCAEYPALRCAAYQRSDVPADEATVMESYALEAARAGDGIDEALQQHIDAAGRIALARWLHGQRHVEVFDALDG
jgi:Domain of unknown function (DUF4936)